jgi:curved DNA-binding protein CbpA
MATTRQPRKPKRSPYEVLGVEPTATPEDIKRAHRERARRAHPDAGGSAETMAEVSEAYAVLKDPQRRLLLDRTGQTEGPPPLEVSIRTLLLQAFTEELANGTEGILDRVRKAIRQMIQRTTDNRAKAQFARSQFERAKKKVRVKRGDNLFHRAIDDRIRAAEAAMQGCENELDVYRGALKAMDNYEQDPESPFGMLGYSNRASVTTPWSAV